MTRKFLELAKQVELKGPADDFLSTREKMFAEMVVYQCIAAVRPRSGTTSSQTWAEAAQAVKNLFGI